MTIHVESYGFVVALVVAVAMLSGGGMFWLSYNIARQSSACAPPQIIFQPGAIQVLPAPDAQGGNR
jgi:hypothetical protein